VGAGGCSNRTGAAAVPSTPDHVLAAVAPAILLQILTAGDDVEDEDEDIGDADAIDDCDR
jgi:hypothetical protein